MNSRRRIMVTIAGAVAAGAFGVTAAAAAELATRAAAFIEARGNEMVAIVNGSEAIDAKRQKVATILRDSVDMQGVAQFVLGRHWRTATPAQRAEYLQLFEDTLIRNLSSRFGELRGVTFSISRNQMVSEADALVSTLVDRPNNPAVQIDWRVSDVNGKPMIVDVVAEGTSLRITQRSEYSAVVQRGGGMDGLLRAMRQQLAQLEAREAAN
jgi:phospholipid transport system substrate-binding protein